MSSITVVLPPDTEQKLRAKAVSVGLTLESYLGRLAEKDAANGAAPREAGFDEIVAPVRQAFRDSGMTDDEVKELVEEAREEAWREQLSRRRP